VKKFFQSCEMYSCVAVFVTKMSICNFFFFSGYFMLCLVADVKVYKEKKYLFIHLWHRRKKNLYIYLTIYIGQKTQAYVTHINILYA